MRRGPARAGHSLPELIVAVTLLGVCLGAAGATAVLGSGRTGAGVLRQEAVRGAALALDSLLTADLVLPGERRWGRVRLTWELSQHGEVPDLEAPHAEVIATGAADEPLVHLSAPWFPPPPLIPWSAQVDP